jgi:5-methyltetrahydrofolate--homocysteine methyltransferase
MADEPAIWKSDWGKARKTLTEWWAGKGLALHVTAPADRPSEDWPDPGPSPDYATHWHSVERRIAVELHRMSHTFFGGVAAPMFNADIGPGTLGMFLGGKPVLDVDTVWTEPIIVDPETAPPIRFKPETDAWRIYNAIVNAALQLAPGRFLVGYPDIIENIDTLSQLRGGQALVWDIIERPDWVKKSLAEINEAYFEVMKVFHPKFADAWGGSCTTCFDIWGPGRTLKVECDFCVMISPKMFREFVTPPMEELIATLDNVLFHVDGPEALPNLDNVLALEGVKAVEFTPRFGQPWGGHPMWYDLYRRIKDAGKAVQAVFVEPEEVLPLIEAVGADGMFITTKAKSEADAHKLLREVGWES